MNTMPEQAKLYDINDNQSLIDYTGLDFGSLTRLKNLASKIENQEVILFIGSAVHSPPPKELESIYGQFNSPPSANSLAQELCRLTDFKQRYPNEGTPTLSRIAQLYELDLNRGEIFKFLNQHIGSENLAPSSVVKGLAEMPFKYIMTTNYDVLFEKALNEKAKSPKIGHYNANNSTPTTNYPENEISVQNPFFYKIHGDIKSNDSIVVTDEDYIDFIIRMNDKGDYNPIPQSFLYAIGQRPILFIGYGLKDYNLKILFKITMPKKHNLPMIYSIDLKPDDITSKIYEEQFSIKFIRSDIWKVVPVLYEMVMKKPMPI
ncbi:MAG TPA: SIR2 family protein [Bacteroidia bacterium]